MGIASARIRCWALCLSLFEYTLQFKRISAHSNADAQSRLLLPIESAIATVSYFQNKTTRDYEESHCSTCNADGTVHQTPKTNYS